MSGGWSAKSRKRDIPFAEKATEERDESDGSGEKSADEETE